MRGLMRKTENKEVSWKSAQKSKFSRRKSRGRTYTPLLYIREKSSTVWNFTKHEAENTQSCLENSSVCVRDCDLVPVTLIHIIGTSGSTVGYIARLAAVKLARRPLWISKIGRVVVRPTGMYIIKNGRIVWAECYLVLRRMTESLTCRDSVMKSCLFSSTVLGLMCQLISFIFI